MSIPGTLIPLFNSGAAGGAYQVQRSLRFNSGDSSFLSRTPGSASNRKTWTWAGWIKRSELDGARQTLFWGSDSSVNSDQNTFELGILSNTLVLGGALNIFRQTTQVFRDASAWMHITVAVDTNNATANERMKIYVNGSLVTAFSIITNLAQGSDTGINQNTQHAISSIQPFSSSRYFSGYLADIHFIDGQALDPSSFTTTDLTTGQLVPKAFTGSYGTNGFKLSFSDNSTAAALGTDTSSNGNTWTTNNFSVTAGSGNDSLVDTPTSYGTDTGAGGEVRGNYCTWNPLAGSTATLSDGNLKRGGSANNRMGTFGMSSGKWYWEIVANSVTGGVFNGITEYSNEPSLYGLNYVYVASTGGKYIGETLSAYANAYGVGDVIGFAYDADNGSLVCYKNGVSQGVLISGLAGKTLFPLCRSDSSAEMVANFGQRAFSYAAPAGYKCLVDTNLPTPVVAKPNTVFDIALSTGTGATRSVTSLNFTPDLLWFKGRSSARDNVLYDSVRGTTKSVSSNLTASEYTGTDLVSFNSNGFTVGPTDVWYAVNETGLSIVTWAWDAGTSTVTNTAGSISSQVRANASAGFAVITGSTPSTNINFTFGHGLGVAPSLVIYKHTAVSGNWQTYHRSGGGNNYNLNSTAGPANSGTWSGLDPTSTLITIPSSIISANSSAFVCYAFSPVSGYSSFGSYTGNGSADGPFVFCNFRPRWVMVKASSSVSYGSWRIYDSARGSYNVIQQELYANISNSEDASNTIVDFLSNGFKLRSGAIDGYNGSGATIIYAAFAESPFQYARAR